MFKGLRALSLDIYVAYSLFTVATGAVFLPNQLISLFGVHAKAYKLLVMLISVVLVLILGILQYKSRLRENSFLVRAISKLRISGFQWTFFFCTCLAVRFGFSSFMRHHTFGSSFDFAIFAQAVWNTWQGDFLYSSIKGGINLLGDHVSPILALFAPLYGVWSDPAVLLIFQAVAAASSGIPIYLIGKRVLQDERLPLIFVFAFFCFEPLRNAVRFDFHPELVGDPLILWAFYCVLTNRLKTASVFLCFVLMTKEIACAPVAMLGLYCWWFRNLRVFGITWFLIAVGVFILDVKLVAPYVSGQEYAYLSGNYLKWSNEGFSAFLQHIFQPSTLTYIKKMFLPLGFFSFLSPSALLLTAPIFVQNILNAGTFPRSTYFQYTTFLTPFVFVSAIYGFRNFLGWVSKQKRHGSARLKLIGAYWIIGCSLVLIGNSEYRLILDYEARDSAHFEYIREYFAQIPKTSSVRTHLFFAPHLAQRKELHIYENEHPREGGSERAQNAEFVVIDQGFLDHPIRLDVEKLISRGYSIYHTYEGFYVLRRT